MANEQQIDNLVSLIDGYVEKDGHHLNVNVFNRETLLDAQAFSVVIVHENRLHEIAVRQPIQIFYRIIDRRCKPSFNI